MTEGCIILVSRKTSVLQMISKLNHVFVVGNMKDDLPVSREHQASIDFHLYVNYCLSVTRYAKEIAFIRGVLFQGALVLDICINYTISRTGQIGIRVKLLEYFLLAHLPSEFDTSVKQNVKLKFYIL
jgi:hypothetical protein